MPILRPTFLHRGDRQPVPSDRTRGIMSGIKQETGSMLPVPSVDTQRLVVFPAESRSLPGTSCFVRCRDRNDSLYHDHLSPKGPSVQTQSGHSFMDV